MSATTLKNRTPGPSDALDLCDCPVANHVHGTTAMYSRHKCRCTPCRKARSDYHLENNRYVPRVARVDASLATQRVKTLRQAGLSNLAISDMTGISPSAIWKFSNGSGIAGEGTVLAKTLDLLNSISYRDVILREITPGTVVSGDTPRLQLQELHARGWCVEDISSHCDLAIAVPYRIMRGYKTTESIRLIIDQGYREMREQQPDVSTSLGMKRFSRARRKATEGGWTVDMADTDEVLVRAA